MGRRLLFWTVACLSLCLTGCRRTPEVMDLSGVWQLALAPSPADWDQLAFCDDFGDTASLPGTLDENQKGTPVTDTTTMHLNRVYTFTGTAWFSREVEIPASWKGLGAVLYLERTKLSAVWVDGVKVGVSTILSASQQYDLRQVLTPGRHRLTIAVNNDPALHTVGGSHAYTDHTQTNWNGILGRMELQPYGDLRLTSLQVYPQAQDRKVTVKLYVDNAGDTIKNARIRLQAEAWNTPEKHRAPERDLRMDLAPGLNIVKATYHLGEDALLWSEYHPALYRLEAVIRARGHAAVQAGTHFGLRDFSAGEYHFAINGVPTFLRGKHDGGTFPLIGYPPVDTAQWLRYFRICRTYGINHVRFHSYTPPEAAFLAADMTGMYIQAELPNWANFTSDDPRHTEWMMREGRALLEDFGNHASFVMFTLGNEIAGESDIAEKMVRDLRTLDNRRLYAFGSNNFLDAPFFGRNDDFWVTFRTGPGNPARDTDVRGSASCNEDAGSGVINSTCPSSRRSYDAAVAPYHMPIIGHETGQYQMYPDYAEIEKYTGVLRAWNLEVFRDRLAAAGMLDQAGDFFKASGASLCMLYKEEMEMARRTEHFAGYQLLDLQDYPGQGTALVGILDAFMDSKGVITPEKFRETGGDVVPLICMDRYCWTWDDTLSADVKVSYFAPAPLAGAKVQWQLLPVGGQMAASGVFDAAEMRPGTLLTAGTVRLPLRQTFGTDGTARALRADLVVSIEGTSYRNSSPVWIYPAARQENIPAGVTVTRRLDGTAFRALDAGGAVVFLPQAEDIRDRSVGPQFINEFWNWLMFKGICESNNRPISQGTLGLLLNPSHPLFADFPTEGHTEWQWWSIMQHARPFILDGTAPDYRPLVQVIDNIDRNHKLGIVFEWKVGAGRLVVCTADLPALQAYPEARQFYGALLRYAASPDCNPSASISAETLRQMF